MKKEINDYLSESIKWKTTGNPRFPYASDFDGENLQIRVNNFPDEPLYTLIIDGERELDFEDWSTKWKRPAASVRPIYQSVSKH